MIPCLLTDMTVGLAFDSFLRSRRLRGLSNNTIDSYRLLTSSFISYIGSGTQMEDIVQWQLDGFLDFLYSQSLSVATVGSYIRNARIFLSWYSDHNQVQYSVSSLCVPKTPKKVVYLYSAADIALIFEKAVNKVPWLTVRNQSMISLMLDSGIRQGEVCNLTIDDLFFNEHRIKVLGKGSKERYVPLGNFSADLLHTYLDMRPFDSLCLFVNNRGNPLTCNAVKMLTSDMQKNLPFEFSSHKLRHNFATNFLINQYEQFGQMDIYQLMSIMGHED